MIGEDTLICADEVTMAIVSATLQGFALPIELDFSILGEQERNDSLRITENDFGYDVVFTLKDSSGTVIDLSLATEATFKAVDIDTKRNFLNAPATISPTPTDGRIIYTVKANDFVRNGNFQAVITINFGTLQTITTKPIFLEVTKSFGN